MIIFMGTFLLRRGNYLEIYTFLIFYRAVF